MIVRCTCCGHRIDPMHCVALELDRRTGLFHDGGVPRQYSGGWHAFGSVCAEKKRRESAAALKGFQNEDSELGHAGAGW